jgi:hypothetical protein
MSDTIQLVCFSLMAMGAAGITLTVGLSAPDLHGNETESV